MGIIFGNREFIDETALPGAQVQHFSLAGTHYGALFIPRPAWDDNTALKVTQELGVLIPEDAYSQKMPTKSNLIRWIAYWMTTQPTVTAQGIS
ncbi:MAG TPA: hypothetical protein DD835_06285 [Halomonas sp.]|nr:hypothetical protein [Halomonas sp.]HBS17439.1 hypothetical protein [Halomonas sp.]